MSGKVFVAEYVLPGHPDKLCDAIADALVEEAGRRERRALCGVEVAVHRASVFVTGRIACRNAETIDVTPIVRSVFGGAGYNSTWYPNPSALKVATDLCLGPLHEGEAEFRRFADDQSIVTGYAVDLPGTNFLPPEHWLASRLSRRLERLRSERPDLLLGPDGKSIVICEEDGNSVRLKAFSASLQQALEGPVVELHRAVLELLREELQAAADAIPGFDSRVPDEVKVNGAGNFAVGGPEEDNGLAGKKLVVDAYGPRVPIGGGALSGKDFYKADRAGAILARRLAKAVAATAARECTATLAIMPGQDRFSVVSLVNEEGRRLDASRWMRLFDLSLAGAGDRYTCATPLVDVARYGHFTDAARPWEQLGFDPRGASGRTPDSVKANWLVESNSGVCP
ncbi:MAG: hypothetical protein DMG09_01190 [Acidobacteria bacterium]|nr:MAG: hypothetical protein DMG09_01190 [Acidobacteriota bacterium]